MSWEQPFHVSNMGADTEKLAFADDIDRWNVRMFEEIVLFVHLKLLGVNYDIFMVLFNYSSRVTFHVPAMAATKEGN